MRPHAAVAHARRPRARSAGHTSEVAVGALLLAVLPLRFWSGARQLETLEARDAVITATIEAFRRHSVRTGTRVQVVEAAESLQRALDAIEIIPARRPKEEQQ